VTAPGRAPWEPHRWQNTSLTTARGTSTRFSWTARWRANSESSPLVSLLATLHGGPGSIPNNLPDVYHRCASLLFSTWDKERGIDVVLPFAEHIRPALRELASWVFTERGTTTAGADRFGFTDRTFLEFFTGEYLADRKQTAEELVEECCRQITLAARCTGFSEDENGVTALVQDSDIQ
jgi:hypothetical protein